MACVLAQVLNLNEPVVDEVGFVYERKAIEQYLSQYGNRPANAPIAGKNRSCFLGQHKVYAGRGNQGCVLLGTDTARPAR